MEDIKEILREIYEDNGNLLSSHFYENGSSHELSLTNLNEKQQVENKLDDIKTALDRLRDLGYSPSEFKLNIRLSGI